MRTSPTPTTARRTDRIEIDLSQLRAIERDKEIPFDFLIKALEEALLNAYLKTEDAHPGARVALDRRSGRVAVMVPELDDEGNVAGEYDDTPSDFGRVAATTNSTPSVAASRARFS